MPHVLSVGNSRELATLDKQTSSTARYSYVLNEGTRILAVDDDPIQLQFASVYLSTPTATVEIAENAELGLKMLESEKFDVMLVDLDMPGMNGIEMIRRVRANPKTQNLPIIMITGREDIVSIDSAYEAGATSFVTKPVNWRVLSYHVRYVLRACATALPAGAQ